MKVKIEIFGSIYKYTEIYNKQDVNPKLKTWIMTYNLNLDRIFK